VFDAVQFTPPSVLIKNPCCDVRNRVVVAGVPGACVRFEGCAASDVINASEGRPDVFTLAQLVPPSVLR
jgi:hypothetical protein